MAKWEFDATRYTEDENVMVPVPIDEPDDEEYDFGDWWPTSSDSKSDTWDDFTGKSFRQLTLSEKMDRVIECLVTGKDDENVRLTRKEIGLYLQYKTPAVGVAAIHSKNRDELRSFFVTRITPGEGQMREKMYYTPKGVYKLMCLSAQARTKDFFECFLAALEAHQQKERQ